jgi:hypothetical protein
MGRPRKQETIEKKVMDAEARVRRLRKEYDEALSELKALREQQRLIQAQQLLDAMDKKGKSFEEVLRLVSL